MRKLLFCGRGAGDNRLSPLSRSPVRSRAPTTTPSPLHPRFVGSNLDSPTGKLDDAKSECHRLPLPPSSPTSPSALPNPRTCVSESSTGNLSKWKRGKLLGRGTFGHVYLGFNRWWSLSLHFITSCRSFVIALLLSCETFLECNIAINEFLNYQYLQWEWANVCNKRSQSCCRWSDIQRMP